MENRRQRYNKSKFLIAFAIVMGIFAIIRHAFSIEVPLKSSADEVVDTQYLDDENLIAYEDWANMDMEEERKEIATAEEAAQEEMTESETTDEGTTAEDTVASEAAAIEESTEPVTRTHHKITGVYSYDKCFPDINDVQLSSAEKFGITPVKNRASAEKYVRNHKLVNISHSPFYKLDNLTHSMPYLVPRAQQLLNTISVNFIDSCQAKGVTPHLLVVTSVLRTTSDVKKLQRGNKNATTNSCHCYGTTVDISYTKFVPVIGHYDPKSQLTRWDEPLKRILSEVLNDLRTQDKCYVKYERKQACFHLTCR